MFSIFKKDPLKNLRDEARSVLHHAGKVWNYRRDIIREEDSVLLRTACTKVEELLGSSETGEAELENAVERLNEVLHDVGGTMYPVKMIPEWVELIVVAVIIAGGIRTFFLQPFKIPTNSMYPTYHGMTAKVHPLDESNQSPVEKAWMKLTQWASTIEVRSPQAGEVLIPLNGDGTLVRLPNGLDRGIFNTGILKSPNYVFALHVGMDKRVPIEVPQEFNFTSVVLHTYFPEEAAISTESENMRWSLVLKNARQRGDIISNPFGHIFLRTRREVKANGRLVNFDVLTGDMVLVDRMSYHFVTPKLGDPFVFATKHIPGLNDNNGQPTDLYYIKRLVGLPGDTLQVKEPVLLRNGDKIAGKPAFDKNNERQTDLLYYGYQPIAGRESSYMLHAPQTIPEHHYFAMGDNSSNSWDSRGWGYVPEEEVIGRALFILYPFTSRWGLAE
ncbi:MAG: signal peptidase I [Puniceicoccales bacterium]|jgi:signal peptidase I|nr:signal peptidase I [Puniceicoccales bacterium]